MSREKYILYTIDKHEGGYINHKNDPGGETNYGISKRAYPHVDIRKLSKNDAVEIYVRDYWHPARLDSFDDINLAWKVFDIGVNMGVRRSIKMLQKIAGVKRDGVIGPITIGKVNLGVDASPLAREQLLRYGYLISKNSKLHVFAKGWIKRGLDMGPLD